MVTARVHLILTIVTCAYAYDSLFTISRHNYGVFLHHRGQLINAEQYWIHLFEIKFEKIPKSEFSLGPCPMRNQKEDPSHNFYCLFRDMIVKEINDINHRAYSDMQLAYNSVKTTLGNHPVIPPTNSRSSRSILAGITTAASWLFGLSTRSDINDMRKQVQKLQNMQIATYKNTLANTGKITSYMHMQNRRLGRIVNAMSHMDQQLKNVSQQLNADHVNTIETQAAILDLLPLLLKKLTAYVNIEKQLDKLLLGAAQLAQGKLSSLLLDERTLAKTLANIETQLIQTHSDFRVTYKNPSHYYAMDSIMYSTTNQGISSN